LTFHTGLAPWANLPFSRLEEVVAKASREGCLMLFVAPEWPSPGYPWWSSVCALCPKKWCFPEGRPIYFRGGNNMMPVPRWKTGLPPFGCVWVLFCPLTLQIERIDRPVLHMSNARLEKHLKKVMS